MSLTPLRTAISSWRPTAGAVSEPVQAICAAWTGIVGEALAAHCTPIEVRGTTLILATGSSGWSQQIQFHSEAILEGLRQAAGVPPIARLAFRSGRLRLRQRCQSDVPPVTGTGRRRRDAPLEAAADLWDAFERVRRRVNRLYRAARVRCSACGVPMPASPSAAACAPCDDEARRTRALAAERALYAMPWLAFADIRDHVAGLDRPAYDRARTHLLGRWRLMLERARRAGRHGALERHTATSYVLLQAQLAPDRITPAIVKNALGPELYAFLYG